MSIDLPDEALCLYDRQTIDQSLDDLAGELNRHFDSEQVTTLCVMNGGLIFSGQLIPRLNFDVTVDYCHATRYRDKTTGGSLAWLAEPRSPIADHRILVLDDILDEGVTLKAIMEHCRQQGAKEVVSAVLLDKKHERRVSDIEADYVALDVEDRYVFGFGMDYEGRYRHLDAIYALPDNAGEDR